jgi:hypothetical protein
VDAVRPSLRRVKLVVRPVARRTRLGFRDRGEAEVSGGGRWAQLAGRFGRLVVIGIDVTHRTTSGQ